MESQITVSVATVAVENVTFNNTAYVVCWFGKAQNCRVNFAPIQFQLLIFNCYYESILACFSMIFVQYWPKLTALVVTGPTLLFCYKFPVFSQKKQMFWRVLYKYLKLYVLYFTWSLMCWWDLSPILLPYYILTVAQPHNFQTVYS